MMHWAPLRGLLARLGPVGPGEVTLRQACLAASACAEMQHSAPWPRALSTLPSYPGPEKIRDFAIIGKP